MRGLVCEGRGQVNGPEGGYVNQVKMAARERVVIHDEGSSFLAARFRHRLLAGTMQ
jgi:hypothetical protein